MGGEARSLDQQRDAKRFDLDPVETYPFGEEQGCLNFIASTMVVNEENADRESLAAIAQEGIDATLLRAHLKRVALPMPTHGK